LNFPIANIYIATPATSIQEALVCVPLKEPHIHHIWPTRLCPIEGASHSPYMTYSFASYWRSLTFTIYDLFVCVLLIEPHIHHIWPTRLRPIEGASHSPYMTCSLPIEGEWHYLYLWPIKW